GNSWADYKDFVGEVQIDGALRNSSVSTDDIAYFSPGLREWHTLLSEINADIDGTVADFAASIRSLRLGESTYLTATATVRGLPDIRRTVFDLDIPRLTTSARDLETLARDIARQELPDNLTRMLSRAGRLTMNARFRGSLSSFDLRAGIASAVGNIATRMALSPRGDGGGKLEGNFCERRIRRGRAMGGV
ncbi:MAG: hypothetical protein K2L09_07595, partial [Alistipes sp.]|nr:hypothetical protein [Alistipes sp.]